MSILDTFTEFTGKDDLGLRAVFEASMTKRIQEKGYKMSDLLFELFQCQLDISSLKSSLVETTSRLNMHATSLKIIMCEKGTKKKKEKAAK
jgi:hypothetical protein